jgi:hypothetical protein
VIALLLCAPEAPALPAELEDEVSAEAAASVLPARSILRRLSLRFSEGGSSRVSLLDIFHSCHTHPFEF